MDMRIKGDLDQTSTEDGSIWFSDAATQTTETILNMGVGVSEYVTDGEKVSKRFLMTWGYHQAKRTR